MSRDRSELMEKAGRCMTRGELDAALRLYLQIFDNDPHDWSVGNTVDDLYVRLGKPDDAVSHFTMLAEQLAADGFAAKARALYRKIVRLQPQNDDARRRVDELDRQQAGQSNPFLKRVLETARALRDAPAAAATPAISTPSLAAPPIAATPIAATPVAPPPVLPAPVAEVPAVTPEPRVTETPAVETPPDRFQQTADRFAEMNHRASALLVAGDYRAAAAAIEQFLTEYPGHILALERLVDIGVDAGLGAELAIAQRRLSDACLKNGHYRRAFDIAVDLCEREPLDPVHREHLDRIIAIARAQGHTFAAPAAAPEPEPAPIAEQPVEVARPRLVPPPAPSAPPPPVVDVADRKVQPPSAPAAATASPAGSIAVGPPFGDLLKEWIDPLRPLEEIRGALLEEAAAAAEEAYAQAVRHIDARQLGAAARPLEEAMCLPHLRATAGSRLAHVYRDTGAPDDALAVLEWVAELPPADDESGHELAYELALTLEALGQQGQALGVYRELLAEVGPNYRDVAVRAQKLAAA